MFNTAESLASMSILLLMCILFGCILLGSLLKRLKFHYLHEAGVALLLGVFLGLFVTLGTSDRDSGYWLRFKKEFFFLFLLPPIIFESGYSMDPKPFFRVRCPTYLPLPPRFHLLPLPPRIAPPCPGANWSIGRGCVGARRREEGSRLLLLMLGRELRRPCEAGQQSRTHTPSP